MIGPDVANVLESGASVIVGTVGDDGMPDASRGWGMWSLAGGTRLRLLVPARDERAVANLRANGRIAVTATVVDTLESIQVKGVVDRVEPPTVDDGVLHERYREAFFRNIHATDGSPVELLRNMAPGALVAVELDVEGVFDQTPGPTAGRSLSR